MSVREKGQFAALLKAYRQAAGLTQEELAERAGISVRSVSDLERGLQRSPYVSTVRRLAEALDLTPEQRAEFRLSAQAPSSAPALDEKAREAPTAGVTARPAWRGAVLPRLRGTVQVRRRRIAVTGAVVVLAVGGAALLRVVESGHQSVPGRATQVAGWGSSVFQPTALLRPGGAAVSASGDLLVADTSRDRVMRFSANGHLIRSWGSRGSAPGQFLQPGAVAVDRHGLVYVADTGNNRVQEFTLSGRLVGSLGSGRSGGLRLDGPAGVAVDSQGYLYISDRGHDRIVLVSPAGDVAGSFRLAEPPGPLAVDAAGHAFILSGTQVLVEYLADRTSSASPELPPALQLPFTPTAVTQDQEGTVYVGGGRGRTVAVVSAPAHLVQLQSRGERATAPESAVGGLAVGPRGQIYVTRPMQHRIEAYSRTGKLESRWGPSFAQGVSDPEGLSVDPEGNVFISDTSESRVLELSASGDLVGSWGGSDFGRVRPRSPAGIATGGNGRVYVADSETNRVESISAGGTIHAVAGLAPAAGALGNEPGRLNGPSGVAVDRAGRLYVADTFNDRVQVFDQRGNELAIWSHFGPMKTQHVFQPTSIAVGPHHSLYLADPWLGRIAVLSDQGSLLRYWNTGRSTGLGLSLAVDARGTVYAANATSRRVELYSPRGSLLGGLCDAEGHPLRFRDPTAVALGPGRTIYVADAGLHRVLKFRLVS